ncbi:DUF115 domain-containing protein [Pelagibacterium sp. 26DY04]|uniref:6-hydroxymethylpterin diphosphokinase MptE-like protein n=1 Tax=Pelagibacterium sp. 26DY04 TaxID=2967130 RepID=UPI0028155FF4|nr:6-hydroxymethylpterin diphosphokinase MptE-like protein [Pelagibacterium sp. 26DY04]WMT87476.1 DUF115 domain-containing protein [Pelagibacterium sp. 26DY04]
MPITARKVLQFVGRTARELVVDTAWPLASTGPMKESRERLLALRDSYHGQPGLVIGNGPSINGQNLGRMTDFVSIAANAFFLKSDSIGAHPTFLTVEDPLPAEDNKERLKAYSGAIKIAPWDLRGTLGDSSDYIYCNFWRTYAPFAGSRFPFYSDDFARRVFWGGTVLYMNIQLASYLGCNPIYLIGVDLTYHIPSSAKIEGNIITSTEDDPNHFDATYFGAGKRWHLPETERMQRCIYFAYEHLRERGIPLINATAGGNLHGLPRADFDTI